MQQKLTQHCKSTILQLKTKKKKKRKESKGTQVHLHANELAVGLLAWLELQSGAFSSFDMTVTHPPGIFPFEMPLEKGSSLPAPFCLEIALWSVTAPRCGDAAGTALGDISSPDTDTQTWNLANPETWISPSYQNVCFLNEYFNVKESCPEGIFAKGKWDLNKPTTSVCAQVESFQLQETLFGMPQIVRHNLLEFLSKTSISRGWQGACCFHSRCSKSGKSQERLELNMMVRKKISRYLA